MFEVKYVLDGWSNYGETEYISALMSTEGTFHIMCPEVVKEDNSKSLYAIIQIGDAVWGSGSICIPIKINKNIVCI